MKTWEEYISKSRSFWHILQDGHNTHDFSGATSPHGFGLYQHHKAGLRRWIEYRMWSNSLLTMLGFEKPFDDSVCIEQQVNCEDCGHSWTEVAMPVIKMFRRSTRDDYFHKAKHPDQEAANWFSNYPDVETKPRGACPICRVRKVHASTIEYLSSEIKRLTKLRNSLKIAAKRNSYRRTLTESEARFFGMIHTAQQLTAYENQKNN